MPADGVAAGKGANIKPSPNLKVQTKRDVPNLTALTKESDTSWTKLYTQKRMMHPDLNFEKKLSNAP